MKCKLFIPAKHRTKAEAILENSKLYILTDIKGDITGMRLDFGKASEYIFEDTVKRKTKKTYGKEHDFEWVALPEWYLGSVQTKE